MQNKLPFCPIYTPCMLFRQCGTVLTRYALGKIPQGGLGMDRPASQLKRFAMQKLLIMDRRHALGENPQHSSPIAGHWPGYARMGKSVWDIQIIYVFYKYLILSIFGKSSVKPQLSIRLITSFCLCSHSLLVLEPHSLWDTGRTSLCQSSLFSW